MQLLDQLVAERDEISTTQTGLVERAAEEARDLTESEDTNLKDLSARAVALDERIGELRSIQVSNLEAARLKAEVAGTDDAPEERAAGRITVTDEPLTYRDGGEFSFFQDMYRAQVLSDPSAQQRIARHQSEMDIEHRADGTSSNWAGLVIPQYAVALAVAKAQAGRNFANACRRLPLPDSGLTVNVSRITTSSSVAAQSSENAAISETTIDDTLMSATVATYAGAQDISRQALERGDRIDEMIYEDLSLSYATSLTADLLDGPGTSGRHTGILRVSGIGDVDTDDGSPTGYETWQKIVKGIGTVAGAKFLQPTVIVMAPRRWSYLVGSLDSQNRPLLTPNTQLGTNVIGVGDAAGINAVGNIAGVPVIVDGNMPTDLGAGSDEDAVVIMRADDVLLWENGGGAPMLARYDSVGSANLTIKIISYGYSAFMVRDPNSVCKCHGTLYNAVL